MNVARRVGLMADLHRAYVLAGKTPIRSKELSNGEVRELARECGLLTARTHSNLNRDAQHRQRDQKRRLQGYKERRPAA